MITVNQIVATDNNGCDDSITVTISVGDYTQHIDVANLGLLPQVIEDAKLIESKLYAKYYSYKIIHGVWLKVKVIDGALRLVYEIKGQAKSRGWYSGILTIPEIYIIKSPEDYLGQTCSTVVERHNFYCKDRIEVDAFKRNLPSLDSVLNTIDTYNKDIWVK